MSETNILWLTFIIYIAIIFAIGIYSYFQTKKVSDYMLGGRSLSAPIAALGAGASDMGSWLLLALPGAFMVSGLNQVWLPLGLTIGAFVNWGVVAKRLRVYTEIAKDSITIPEYFENRFHDKTNILRSLTALVTVVFFTIYIGAGFVSGGVLFSSMFHISYHEALIFTAIIIFTYTCVGGFLAIAWIDFFQGTLMLLALIMVPLCVYFEFGNVDVVGAISNIKIEGFYDITSGIPLITIVSLLAWGLGYFGQPHIIVRFMAIKDPNKTPKAMWICMIWMILALIGAACVGILGAAYYTDGISNPEAIFLKLSAVFFNPWIEGVLLAAVLSAVMSTSSAQLLSLSSAFSVDVYAKFIRKNASHREQLNVSRLIVFIVTIVAIIISYNPDSSILNLVSYAWAGLGSSFGAVIIFSLFWSRMNKYGAIVGIIVGSVIVVIWPFFEDFGGWFKVYSMVPAFTLSCISIIVFSLVTGKPADSVQEEYKSYKLGLNK
ncbi:sodium/proline symporter PutP [Francisella adeliensis]|uniref:Sodium/proline symporter n=1 Tax=Francisella adeliensis TaxID=2007306 RepID=A0A2Z4XYL8_9GAMM|nr:sodium/proline symporter PutP [Francisella adeliensis]AXA33971.1 sodium/proline symporter [Francisella adeliensis]MBK2085880.1 sodium/proline symporter PutP [Francisella adeliensis]MBK2097758.1 sodium/proline symporter PutP [Francisella adeliensis]QIW12207.1 sodium/proline symporter PutP [Francisella adeliensis]QIW14083.1 sodium/proline symporter PutP [Francisella adeliensis]